MNALKFRPELLELEDRTVPAALVVDGRTPIVNILPNGQLQQVWTGVYNGESPIPLVSRVVMGQQQVVAWESSPDGYRVINVVVADFAGEIVHQHVLWDAPSVVGVTGPPLASLLSWSLEIQASTDAEEPYGPGEITVIWIADGIHQAYLGNVRFNASSVDGGLTFSATTPYTETVDDDEPVQQLRQQKQPKHFGKHAKRVGNFFARNR